MKRLAALALVGIAITSCSSGGGSPQSLSSSQRPTAPAQDVAKIHAIASAVNRFNTKLDDLAGLIDSCPGPSRQCYLLAIQIFVLNGKISDRLTSATSLPSNGVVPPDLTSLVLDTVTASHQVQRYGARISPRSTGLGFARFTNAVDELRQDLDSWEPGGEAARFTAAAR